MQIMTRNLGVALAGMLACAAGSATLAADSPAAGAQPGEETRELGEIWVRGKSLSDVIVDAEDDFFRLYNQLNRKHDYDVTCGYARLDRNSLAMDRVCAPMYLTYDSYFSNGASGYSLNPNCNGVNAPTTGRDLGSSQDWYMASCEQAANFRYGAGAAFTALSSSPIYIGMSLERSAARQQEYLRNVMRTVYRDQRLMEKASALKDLYAEMHSLQDQFTQRKAEDRSRRDAERREQRRRD